jgi:hypothetical protein
MIARGDYGGTGRLDRGLSTTGSERCGPRLRRGLGDSSESPGESLAKSGSEGSGLTDLPPSAVESLNKPTGLGLNWRLDLGLFNLTTARFRRS